MADVELLPCGECGMPCRAGEYHPFAACLMFKACHNSETVRANMEPLLAEVEGLKQLVRYLAGNPNFDFDAALADLAAQQQEHTP